MIIIITISIFTDINIIIIIYYIDVIIIIIL